MSLTLTDLPHEVRQMIYRHLFIAEEPILIMPKVWVGSSKDRKKTKVSLPGYNLVLTSKLLNVDVKPMMFNSVFASLTIPPKSRILELRTTETMEPRFYHSSWEGYLGVWPSKISNLHLDSELLMHADFQSLMPKFKSLSWITTTIKINCVPAMLGRNIVARFCSDPYAKERRKSPHWKPVFKSLEQFLTTLKDFFDNNHFKHVFDIKKEACICQSALAITLTLTRGDEFVEGSKVLVRVTFAQMLERIDVRNRRVTLQKSRNAARKLLRKAKKSKLRKTR